MTNEEAELYADKMTYEEAIYNVMCGYGIPYKKATKNKLTRLANEFKNVRDKIDRAIEEIRKLDDLNPDYEMDKREYVSKREVIDILRNIGG